MILAHAWPGPGPAEGPPNVHEHLDEGRNVSRMRVGFIGLGQMGIGIAGCLLDHGHDLTVYNRTPAKADPLVERGAALAASPAQAAVDADVVMTMVADDAALEAVAFGEDGLIAGLAEGGVHVSCSTISVGLAARLTEAHDGARQGFVAAPVFGRPQAAASARLLLVAAGDPGDLTLCGPVFEAMADRVAVVGETPAAASLFKITGNFLIATVVESLSEAFALLDKSGVDPAQFLEVMTGSLFSAPIYKNYGRMILEGEFDPAGFALRLGLKDVSLGLEAGAGSAVPLPLASLMRDHLLEGMAQGYGDLDWCSVSRVIARHAGLT